MSGASTASFAPTERLDFFTQWFRDIKRAKSKATQACSFQDATSSAFYWSVQVIGQPDSRKEEIDTTLDGEEQHVRTGMGGFKQGKYAGHVVDK